MPVKVNSTLAVALSGRLAQDERMSGSQVDVLNNNGVVTLNGIVLDEEARAAAVEIALNHPGVLSVISDLEIGDPDATTELSIVLPLPAHAAFHGE